MYYGNSTSAFYLVGLFDLWDGVRTLAISSIGVYCIAKYLPSSPFMPWIAFAFLMGHMSVNHIARQIADSPSSVDITGAQMVLLMKLSAFCWNVADGQLPEDHLSEFQKERRLVELPGLLDYAGYVLFFPSLFAGPAFDYTDYRKWIDTTMFDLPAQVDPSKKPPVRKKRKIPRSGTPAALKAAAGLGWIGLFMVLSGYYPITYLTSPSFVDHGFLRRVWILHMAGLTARLKYYGVWYLTEGACILAGLGYNGVDPVTGKVSWNRLQNINPWGVETAQNTRAYLGNWNMNTNNWLRNYVYLRVTPRGKKPGFRASLLTFGTSALWHGFYPGYYMSFILASFIQTVAKSKCTNAALGTLHVMHSGLISYRLPPLFPCLFHRCQQRRAHLPQDLLRRPFIRGHPADYVFHCRPLPCSRAFRFSFGLVPRLLLHDCWHRALYGLLCLPSEADTEETAGGTSRQSRG